MQDAKIQSLANTLKMTGLASSVTDALRMATTIIGTEQKVSTEFNRYSPQPAPSKKTYQEEIDELIKKTSPEYKQYHIPVKGYKRDESPALEKAQREVFYELDQPTSSGQNLVLKQEIKPEVNLEVYTDAFESSQKPLHEVMNVVEHGDVLTSVETSLPSLEPELEKSDEFIVPEEKLPEQPEPVISSPLAPPIAEEKEELFKEIKEDKSKPHEVKNPIQSVDLMSYFKAF